MKEFFVWCAVVFVLLLAATAFAQGTETKVASGVWSGAGDVACFQTLDMNLCVSPSTAAPTNGEYFQRFNFSSIRDDDKLKIAYCFPEPIEPSTFHYVKDFSRTDLVEVSLSKFDWSVSPVALPKNPNVYKITLTDKTAALEPKEIEAKNYAVKAGTLELAIAVEDFGLYDFGRFHPLPFDEHMGYCYFSEEFSTISKDSIGDSWELRFTPMAKSGEWLLIVYRGTGDCIFDSAKCDAFWLLDPYWQFDSSTSGFVLDNFDNGNTATPVEWTYVDGAALDPPHYIRSKGEAGGYGFARTQCPQTGDCSVEEHFNNDTQAFAQSDFPARVEYRTWLYSTVCGGTNAYVNGSWNILKANLVANAVGEAGDGGVRFLVAAASETYSGTTSTKYGQVLNVHDNTHAYYKINHPLGDTWCGSYSNITSYFELDTIYRIFPDANVGSFVSRGNYVGGSTVPIDFNVHHWLDGMELHLKLAYEPTNNVTPANAFTNIITPDLNLNSYARTDDNLSCDTNVWSGTGHCTYLWNMSLVPDGNYYLDFNFSVRSNAEGDRNSLLASDWFTTTLNTAPTTNVLGDFNHPNYIKGGTDHNVQFSMTDVDDNASAYLVDANLSLACLKGTGIKIFDDLNLATGFVHDTNNLNAGFDVNFYWKYSVPAYDFNACLILDFNKGGLFYSKISDFNILVDSTKPTTASFDLNKGWNYRDQNIHLQCVDNNSGCSSTTFRLDSNSLSGVSWGAWQAYDKNIFIRLDGNWAVDFNSTDNAGNVGDENVFFVLIDKTAPTIANSVPSGDTSSATTSFSFAFAITDNFAGTDNNCDYNAMRNGIPYGAQNLNVPVVNGLCSIGITDSGAGAGNIYDVNAMVRDAFNKTVPIRSFRIVYAPSGGLPPAGGGGGGAPSLSGEGGFCITSNDCLLNLVCDNFSCRRIAGLEDMNLVFVLPREITSSPFEDVLPASKITLSNISVVNRSDVPIDLDLFFACSGSDHCAKDWCVLKEADRSFVLQGQGVKILSAECEIPSVGALIGETYFTQLVAQSKRTKVSRSSSIIIPLQKAIIPADYRVYLAAGKSVLNYGLVCFGNSKVDCALRLGEQPIQFAGVELNLEVWTVAAIAAVVLLVLFTHWAWFALFIVVVVLRFALG